MKTLIALLLLGAPGFAAAQACESSESVSVTVSRANLAHVHAVLRSVHGVKSTKPATSAIPAASNQTGSHATALNPVSSPLPKPAPTGRETKPARPAHLFM